MAYKRITDADVKAQRAKVAKLETQLATEKAKLRNMEAHQSLVDDAVGRPRRSVY